MANKTVVDKEKLEEIIRKLFNYIKLEDYKGYDPYDLLNSPIFKLPILKTNKTIRFISQQVFRRIPINFRPLLGIRKELNPVTAGLCIQAYSYLLSAIPEKKEIWLNEISYLIDKLEETKSIGYSGYCWGYNFDWEARYAKIPKYFPTVVATGIIINGLFEYWKISKDKRVEQIIISSADFVLNDLNRSYEGNSFCFSYSPNDHQKVYNATMKAARLLSQVYLLTQDKKYIDEAKKTVDYVINNQNEDGSWYYSKGDARKWVDNFHTAYVLDGLKFYYESTNDSVAEKSMKLGLNFYLENLFTEEGYPKYYSNEFFPIDATATSQSIITLLNFDYSEKAAKAIKFAIEHLYNSSGYFYYQKNLITNKQSYIRWSVAWFLVAFSHYFINIHSKNVLV